MEEIYIINEKTFQLEGIIDEYSSFIWTDRYDEYGDFEIYVPALPRYISLLTVGRLVWIETSERQMIIENITVASSLDNGKMLTVSGRSLESILCRRVIWGRKVLNGNIHNLVKSLITECIISPSDSKRKIPNFAFIDSTDERLLALTYSSDEDVLGKELYEVIQTMCSGAKIGFKITKNDSNVLEFRLYMGEDRSYSQEVNPYICLSPVFDNIISSEYQSNSEEYKNLILVSGSDLNGEEKKDIFVTAGDSNVTGLDRRETYVNAADISSKEVQNMNQALIARGESELKVKKITSVYSGEINSDITYVYDKDYFIGDIVQLENDMNIQTRVQIKGFTRSIDTGGYTSYPELEFIDSDSEGGI